MKILALFIAVFILTATVVPAQEPGGMRDPFFPSAGRPRGPASPSGDLQLDRDPFANPLGRPAATQPRPAAPRSGLTGIIYSAQSRLAIYNGEVLAEGAVVGDRRIVNIRRRSVVLATASGRYEEVFLEDFTLGR